MKYAFFLAILFTVTQPAQAAACRFPNRDALATTLAAAAKCPADVFELRALLEKAGAKFETALVANRGFHNPSQGSFSMFEMVTGIAGPGEFFFGHFTTAEGAKLVADQSPSRGSLMIEALAFDPRKGLFNFYELRGDGQSGQWFYQGDSADIFADNKLLHRQPNPAQPKFGDRLRCSACHSAGGPIMKELTAPHNDWWNASRGLDFGGRVPDAALAKILGGLVPAEKLAKSVALGLKKLEASEGYQKLKGSLSLQEKLRPLFCPVELNIKSDLNPNGANQDTIAIPADFFVDSQLLVPAQRKPLAVSRKAYEATLEKFGSEFPEVTGHPDADHAWLTPVKAHSDKLAIAQLIKQGLIDAEFASDVLAVDFTNPVVSHARCSLLQHVPQKAGRGWIREFVDNLTGSRNPAATELKANLIDPARTRQAHASKAASLLASCAQRLNTPNGADGLYALLVQRRAEISSSEISANPRGQILEPGFRVIFPKSGLKLPAGGLKLNHLCKLSR